MHKGTLHYKMGVWFDIDLFGILGDKSHIQSFFSFSYFFNSSPSCSFWLHILPFSSCLSFSLLGICLVFCVTFLIFERLISTSRFEESTTHSRVSDNNKYTQNFDSFYHNTLLYIFLFFLFTPNLIEVLFKIWIR